MEDAAAAEAHAAEEEKKKKVAEERDAYRPTEETDPFKETFSQIQDRARNQVFDQLASAARSSAKQREAAREMQRKIDEELAEQALGLGEEKKVKPKINKKAKLLEEQEKTAKWAETLEVGNGDRRRWWAETLEVGEWGM